MGVQISEIKNAEIQKIATKIDNGDGVLKRKEYMLFAQEASAQGFESQEIYDTLGLNGFQRWWYDVDKISTDGVDDGKISGKEKAKSFTKGLFGGIVKNIVKNPLESAISILGVLGVSKLVGLGAAAITGAAISAPVAALVAGTAGLGFGIYALVKGINQTRKAETDGDAKTGMETAGTGAAITALSGFGLFKLFKNVKSLQNQAKITKEVKGYNDDGRVINTTYDENGVVVQEKVHANGYRYSSDAFKIEKTLDTETGVTTVQESVPSSRHLETPQDHGWGYSRVRGIETSKTIQSPNGKTLFRIDFKPVDAVEYAAKDNHPYVRALTPEDAYQVSRFGEDLPQGHYYNITEYHPYSLGKFLKKSVAPTE